MKIKENYVLQKIEDENIAIPVGDEAERVHGVIRLNETGAFLWEKIAAGDMSIEQVTDALISEYNVDYNTAKSEIESFISQLKSIGCIEE